MIKNENDYDVDALMTFTIITRPFFYFDIYMYISIFLVFCFFQFSGVNVRALNEGLLLAEKHCIRKTVSQIFNFTTCEDSK